MISTIPTYIIEEHHEAFIVWNQAIQQQYIPRSNNILIHIDEHSDMGTPRFNSSILKLNGDLETIKKFAYKELNIAGFIIPSIYQGIFSQIDWIKYKHRNPDIVGQKMYVRSYNQDGKKLITGKVNIAKKDISDFDRKEFDYFLRTIEQIQEDIDVVLDIDLDYFSCAGNPNELKEIYVEITEKEFENFTSNRYHRLNYCGLAKIEAVKDGDGFYYVINNYKDIYPSSLMVSEQEINDRIDKLINTLKQKRIKPLLITICRSAHSGYTDKKQVGFIQDMVINKLSEIYHLEFNNLIEKN